VGSSLGSSPLVLATAPAKAAKLAAVATRRGWGAALAGPTPTTLVDPTASASGALMVLGLNAVRGDAPGSAAQLVGLYLKLQAGVLPDAAAGFAALQRGPTSAAAFVTTEVDVFHANEGRTTPIAAAVYPSGPTPSLDFPVVRVAPSGSDPRVMAAAAGFERQLTTPRARAELGAAGLRDAAGTPLNVNSAAAGVSSQRVAPGPATITPIQQAAALRLWSAAARPSNLLGVVDVSGSMGNESGNGQTKIQVAADAIVAALSLVPDDWTVGLWAFSTRLPPAPDWTALAPLGELDGRRPALVAQARALPSLIGGNTGLYDTALGAFQDVSQRYDPHDVNVVALLTDGANVDPNGIDLATLLARLKAEYNPAQPVKIVTIGFGQDADASALKQISDATHGQAYVVKNPDDIRGVLLDSIIANN
jgi:Ca-activated chloride channel family protein